MQELNRENKSRPDPWRVAKAIADIISDREGIKVTVKSVTKKDQQKTA